MKKDIPLTDVQCALVELNLSIVDWVLLDHITDVPHVVGLSREDLYQEGCLWLCRAAATYDGKRASFGTYARTVVRNGLISYCRQVTRRPPALPLASDLTGDASSGEERGHEPRAEDTSDALISQADTLHLLQAMQREHTGVVKLGLEALELKVKGFNGADIAAMYGVRPNNVSAWIAKATQKLRTDPHFLAFFQ